MAVRSDTDGPSQNPRSLTLLATNADCCEHLLWFIFIAGLAHAAYYLLLGIASPLFDLFSFRQTQTALSAYWIWRGGPWLAYQTPVLGYPWSLPFEFPIYQGLVATLRMVGVPIDIGGRLLTFSFYIGCLWPLWSFFRTIKLPQAAFLATGTLFLWSPIYIYWGRTVLIESCALFFCLLWLAQLARFLQTAAIGPFIGAMSAGVMGILCKVTTFPAVAALGGILVLTDIYRAWSAGILVARLRVLALVAALVIIPLVAEIEWVAFSDAIKEQNPFGKLLTSQVLFGWNFGTWPQRISSLLWQTIWNRSFPDIFGSSAVVAVVIAGAGLFSYRYSVAILAAALAFLIPFLLFTNVHIIHSYYQNANAIFALAAVGIAIAAIAETWQRALAPPLLAVIVCGQIYFFHRDYAPVIATDFSNDRSLRIALLAKEKTQPTDALIVIGQDWSSAVAYYSERKSLSIPMEWPPASYVKNVLENPKAFLGGTRLGGIVMCPITVGEPLTDLSKHYGDRMPLIEAFITGRAIIGEVQGCQLLAPDR